MKRRYLTIRFTAGAFAFPATVVLIFWLQSSSGSLADYVYSQSFRIPAVPNDFSGITYCSASKTLFMISKAPHRLFVTGLKGGLLRLINPGGFQELKTLFLSKVAPLLTSKSDDGPFPFSKSCQERKPSILTRISPHANP